MPILITKEIIAATKQPKAGWNLLELRDFKPKVNKKSQGVIDYYWTFECIAGPGNTEENAGRSFTVIIYGNALTTNVTEANALLVGLSTAITKKTMEELEGQEIAFEKMEGARVWCEIKDEPFEGRILKKANCFTPDDVVPF